MQGKKPRLKDTSFTHLLEKDVIIQHQSINVTNLESFFQSIELVIFMEKLFHLFLSIRTFQQRTSQEKGMDYYVSQSTLPENNNLMEQIQVKCAHKIRDILFFLHNVENMSFKIIISGVHMSDCSPILRNTTPLMWKMWAPSISKILTGETASFSLH